MPVPAPTISTNPATGEWSDQYEWDPILGQWKPKASVPPVVMPPVPPPAGTATGGATTGSAPPPVQTTAVPPPAGSQAPPASSYVPAPPPTSILSGLNFEEELARLTREDPAAAEAEALQFGQIKKDIASSDFGPEDQKILDLSIADATTAAALRTRQVEKAASGTGLRESSNLIRSIQQETDRLSSEILRAGVDVRTRALERNAAKRAAASQMAASFAAAIRNRNVGTLQALLQAKTAETEAELSREQLGLQRQIVEENIRMGRDKFTEEQRAALRAEGFDERRIAMAENQTLWERTFRQNQQTADITLANRNFDIQETLGTRQLDIQERQVIAQEARNDRNQTLQEAIFAFQREIGLDAQALERERVGQAGEGVRLERDKFEQLKREVERQFNLQLDSQALERMIRTGQLDLAIVESQRGFDLNSARLAMDQLRNNADISLQERTFSLTEQFGLSDREFDREKFEAMTAQLEREFGLSMNQFALEKTIRTGELDLNILNSQRRYDLDVESQRQQWINSQAALDLQRELGMADIDLRRVLGEGQLDISREEQILEKWMFEQGLSWEKDKFRQQLAAARRKKKGGLLGGIIKTLVGAGVGFLTGGPAGAVAGAAGAIFGGNSSDVATMINTVAGERVAQPSSGAGTTVQEPFGGANYG